MRPLLIVVLGVIVIALGHVFVSWVRENTFIQPRPPVFADDAKVQHASYQAMAISAFKRFRELPEAQRRAVVASLDAHLLSMPEWLAALTRDDPEFLCLGERHEEQTRRFLARRFFPDYLVDTLFLEASEQEIASIIARVDDGEAPVPLLDADIAELIRAARTRNAAVSIAGVDESDQQRKVRTLMRTGFRDSSIARNIGSRLQSGRRNAVLFGALHCANQPNWLFDRVAGRAGLVSAQRAYNVNVIGVHQDGPTEAFASFLRRIGRETATFVVVEPDKLHPLLYEWFSPLRVTFTQYRAAIVFHV